MLQKPNNIIVRTSDKLNVRYRVGGIALLINRAVVIDSLSLLRKHRYFSAMHYSILFDLTYPYRCVRDRYTPADGIYATRCIPCEGDA